MPSAQSVYISCSRPRSTGPIDIRICTQYRIPGCVQHVEHCAEATELVWRRRMSSSSSCYPSASVGVGLALGFASLFASAGEAVEAVEMLMVEVASTACSAVLCVRQLKSAARERHHDAGLRNLHLPISARRPHPSRRAQHPARRLAPSRHRSCRSPLRAVPSPSIDSPRLFSLFVDIRAHQRILSHVRRWQRTRNIRIAAIRAPGKSCKSSSTFWWWLPRVIAMAGERAHAD
ncbi:hypothetical protein B0H12DRAFT_1240625 [Mycena haematopus]|nr:hypothetical protein B0H12DRAFT_1240625 [Mycena haematopus]